jgi:hypothetical protein
MTNPVIALCEVAFRRRVATSSLTKKANKTAALVAQVTALFLAITVVFFSLSFLFLLGGSTEALAADGDDDSSPAKAQERWNKEMPLSKAHDGQPRPQDVNEGLQVIHKSQPAPDRTMQRFYMLVMPLQKQGKQNQDGQEAGNKGNQNNYNPRKPQHPPIPVRNSDYGKLSKLASDLFEQVGGAPQQKMAAAVANMQGQQQGAGDAAQRGAINALQEYFPMIIAGNPNVANEGAGGGIGHSSQPFRPLSQAIGMVQHMYHHCYLPMALLLLLPGAALLHMKNMCSQFTHPDEDGQGGPWGHILRAMIALFLIPSTQLIMSYAIDVGNSMTFSVAQQFSPMELVGWAEGMQNEREAKGKPQERLDPQPFKEQMWQMAAGIINMSLGYGLIILVAFQLALSCYLFLMGPIAASLYTWPGSVGKLFKPIFINWVNGVVVLSMWRFWWVVISFVMVTRIHWLQEIGEYVPNTEWEALMLGCFLVMMMYVPFAPFDCRPGDMVDKILEKGREISQAASGKKAG